MMIRKSYLRILLVLVLALVVAVSFSACGGGDPSQQTGGEGGGTTVEEEGDYWVTDFKVTKMPDKLIYAEGELFDASGIDVEITWNDGLVWTLSGGDISLSDLAVLPRGELTMDVSSVQVIFDEYSVNIPVTVGKIDRLEVARDPAKKSYKPGEAFDPSGMLLTAWAGESSMTVEDFDYSPKGALTEDDDHITITYRGVTLEYPISVNADSIYLEAEAAELVKGSEESKMSSKLATGKGLDLCEKASGGDFVVDAIPGDSIVFTFEMKEAGPAYINLAAASNATEIGSGTASEPSKANDMRVNKVYEFYINGSETKMDITDAVVLKGVEIEGGSRETWVYWRLVTLGIAELDEGENTIEMRIIGGGGYRNSYDGEAYGQIDALEVVPTAYDCETGAHKLIFEKGTPPTCTENGTADSYVCETCGKRFDADGEEIEDITVPSYGGHLYDVVPRYSSESEHTYECVRCGETTTEAHSAPESGKGYLVVAKAPNKTWYYAGQTLDKDRMEVYTSTVCDKGCKCAANVDPSAITVTYANGSAFTAGDTYVDLSYESGGVTYTGRLTGLTVAAEESDILTADSAEGTCAVGGGASIRATDKGGAGQSGYGGSYVSGKVPGSATFTIDVTGGGTGRLVLRVSSNRVVKGSGSESNPEYAKGIAAADSMRISLNGEEITVPASAVIGGSISNLEASSNRWTWTNWYDLDLGEVTLADGANEITVTFLDNGFGDTYDNPACGQVDCANIFFGGEVA